jgi:hypothetical protein
MRELLGFAFLSTTSVLFLLWHVFWYCRAARVRELERRLQAAHDGQRGDAEALASLAGLTAPVATAVARGAPLFLIRSLPTHVYCEEASTRQVRPILFERKLEDVM